jgi:hypothetical protein
MSLTWRPNNAEDTTKTTTPQRYYIDGPRISSSALQVVSEALDIQQQNEDTLLSPHEPSPTSQKAPSGHYGGKTIVASDGDVSNGFVKCGRSLPYVFEANESGKFFGFSSCLEKMSDLLNKVAILSDSFF